MNTNNEILKQAVDRHMETMTEKELEMVLRFIYNLKDFREVTA